MGFSKENIKFFFEVIDRNYTIPFEQFDEGPENKFTVADFEIIFQDAKVTVRPQFAKKQEFEIEKSKRGFEYLVHFENNRASGTVADFNLLKMLFRKWIKKTIKFHQRG
ncbi:hypothetical protein ACFL35_12560 [Candidatus Riflebacteria bacterium]